MAHDFRMPLLGADMDAGTLIEWLKAEGDHVSSGDIVAVVETQKGAIEIEIFQDGVIDRLLVEPGQTVPVGTPLASVRGPDEEPETAVAGVGETAAVAGGPAGPVPEETRQRARPRHDVPTQPGPAATRQDRAAAGARITPGARKLAAEHGISLEGVSGTGPGGIIQRSDVERLLAEPAEASVSEPQVIAPSTIEPGQAAGKPAGAEAMRHAIASAMARSKREIPHYYLAETMDMAPALAWLEARNADAPVAERVLPVALLAKATACALAAMPEFNGTYQDGVYRPAERVHLGCAIGLRGGGLIAPGIRDADAKDLATLMADLSDLVRRARSGGLRSSELSDPTSTMTSLGDQGVDDVFGVIFPPQVAIIGFGTIEERPFVVDGAVIARPVVRATLSADHRVSDGHAGGRFLTRIARHLRDPEAL